MSRSVQVELSPSGRVLSVERDAPLLDLLFGEGVEFPCGGRGRCKGCRIKVRRGDLPITEDDQRRLSPDELAGGYRLGCRAKATDNLQIELVQWEAAVLADDSVFEFAPRPGAGIAVDVGTTTLVAQLLDLETGQVLGVRTAWNLQARHGADIMSRIEFAAHQAGQAALTRLIREQVGGMLGELLRQFPERASELRDVVLVGNTAMHHLFCGLDVEPLAHSPFETPSGGLQTFAAAQLDWPLPDSSTIRFLPCLGGFVGSDILAGILATRLHETDDLTALMDLGTNGEIVLGNRRRLLCASTAAGPAFEGARISMGMRASSGAISAVQVHGHGLHCHVLGGIPPRGICGSGLVDAAACALDLQWIQSSGRLADQSGRLVLAAPVTITQADIRELQLAKGALAAGLRLLAGQWGSGVDDISRIYLAGAFGNYINRASAHRIGLLKLPPDQVVPAGNTALLGAKLALFDLAAHDAHYAELRSRIHHLGLSEDPEFHEAYVGEMRFPERVPSAAG